ncbi:MAG: hypothetical protein IK083_05330 [Abditibacteriota bacterium]|nr:hypothetical protein [Abditibacteriota bacterium]
MKHLAVIVMLVLLASGMVRAGVVMFPQPWREGGANMREMINDPDGWKESRAGVDTIGYWPWLLELYHPAEEQQLFFGRLKEWDKKLDFEVPVVKGYEWTQTKAPLEAVAAYRFYMAQDRQFRKNGMEKVDTFSFDEPVYAARVVLPSQIAEGKPEFPGFRLSEDPKTYIDYACRQTALFMKLMQKEYPDARYVDIEPYPGLSLEELKYTADALQRECEKLRIKEPDALRIEIEWSTVEAGTKEGSWQDIRKLCDHVRSKGMEFSFIYWAADKALIDPLGVELPLQWYWGVMHNLSAARIAGIVPDEFVYESWIHMPNRFGPETDNTTYTGCLRDWLSMIGK